jgi:hypothetical protein
LLASTSACSGGTQAGGHDGSADGHDSGADGHDGDADATASENINYGICDMTSTTIFRIDRAAMTCTFVVLAPAGASCASGTMISGRCFLMAGFSTDVASCDALQIPGDAVAATAAAGTFRTYVTDPGMTGGIAVDLADFDLTLSFPADAGVPTSDHFAGSGCLVACLRPTSACGT